MTYNGQTGALKSWNSSRKLSKQKLFSKWRTHWLNFYELRIILLLRITGPSHLQRSAQKTVEGEQKSHASLPERNTKWCQKGSVSLWFFYLNFYIFIIVIIQPWTSISQILCFSLHIIWMDLCGCASLNLLYIFFTLSHTSNPYTFHFIRNLCPFLHISLLNYWCLTFTNTINCIYPNVTISEACWRLKWSLQHLPGLLS